MVQPTQLHNQTISSTKHITTGNDGWERGSVRQKETARALGRICICGLSSALRSLRQPPNHTDHKGQGTEEEERVNKSF